MTTFTEVEQRYIETAQDLLRALDALHKAEAVADEAQARTGALQAGLFEGSNPTGREAMARIRVLLYEAAAQAGFTPDSAPVKDIKEGFELAERIFAQLDAEELAQLNAASSKVI